MPDTTLADGLIKSAAILIASRKGRVSQANLRRAISATYYAVFHELAKHCADSLVGKTKSKRPNKAWVEVYRGLDHGTCKDACSRAAKVSFPAELKDFSDAFEQLQAARHSADYDPMIRISKAEALLYLSLANASIAAIRAVPRRDKIAFATWVLITTKGARDARARARDGRARALIVPHGKA